MKVSRLLVDVVSSVVIGHISLAVQNIMAFLYTLPSVLSLTDDIQFVISNQQINKRLLNRRKLLI